MEALSILEKKISVLLGLVKELKEQNGGLKKECEQLRTERVQLEQDKLQRNDENAQLHLQVAQLTEKLEAIEESMLVHNSSVDRLNQEKAETRTLIDDLIKDIDSLVESENQQ